MVQLCHMSSTAHCCKAVQRPSQGTLWFAVPEEVNVALTSDAQSTSAVGAPAARESGAPKVAHDVPANGNGGLQLYGDSPRSGWEGADSELGFPLDDIPREHAGSTHRAPGRAPLAHALCPLKLTPDMCCIHLPGRTAASSSSAHHQ